MGAVVASPLPQPAATASTAAAKARASLDGTGNACRGLPALGAKRSRAHGLQRRLPIRPRCVSWNDVGYFSP